MEGRWEAPRRAPPPGRPVKGVTSMPNPVVHWEIVSNTRGEELQRFYADLFGWEVRADNPFNYGLVDRQTERGIAGGIGPTEGPSRVTIYAEVDDPQRYLDRAVSLRAAVLLPVTA